MQGNVGRPLVKSPPPAPPVRPRGSRDFNEAAARLAFDLEARLQVLHNIDCLACACLLKTCGKGIAEPKHELQILFGLLVELAGETQVMAMKSYFGFRYSFGHSSSNVPPGGKVQAAQLLMQAGNYTEAFDSLEECYFHLSDKYHVFSKTIHDVPGQGRYLLFNDGTSTSDLQEEWLGSNARLVGMILTAIIDCSVLMRHCLLHLQGGLSSVRTKHLLMLKDCQKTLAPLRQPAANNLIWQFLRNNHTLILLTDHALIFVCMQTGRFLESHFPARLRWKISSSF